MKYCIYIFLICLIVSCSDRNDYDSLKHYGKKKIEVRKLSFNPFSIDASETSLSGQWLMKDSIIYFIDKYAVDCRLYDTNGNFLSDRIKQGRGPNEMICPASVSSFDNEGNLFVYNNNSQFCMYSPSFIKKFETKSAWWLPFDNLPNSLNANDLLRHPDPSNPQIYELNSISRGLHSQNDTLYIPIETSHVAFNGFVSSAYSRKFWKYSYILMSFKYNDLLHSYNIFGHYPPIYYKHNIPVFSTYSFTVAANKLYVSFAADPNIYVMSLNGKLLYSIGFPEKGISGKYPQTKTFDEFEGNFSEQREKYGYYASICSWKGFLFRTCKLDNGKWKLQIYNGYDMIGDVSIDNPLYIFGSYNGFFYCYVNVDLDREQFKLVKFKLGSI